VLTSHRYVCYVWFVANPLCVIVYHRGKKRGRQTMAVDTTRLDTKIKRLQKLKELLDDPDACDALSDPDIMTQIRDSLGNNGHHAIEESPTPTYFPGEGTVRLAVYEAAKRINGSFDTRAIISEMKKAGYKFTAKSPKAAVYGILKKLWAAKLLKLVRTGSGRSPSTFTVRE
jgi:hypothetical protein